MIVMRPQKGPQEKFLSTPADLAIYGGAAGGGKTHALLMEAARFHYVPRFSAVIFRQTYGDITNPGGLWDESGEMYVHLGAKDKQSALRWVWPKFKSKVQFSHFQHEKYKFNWQGSQIPMIGWDELTHFSESIFFYMISRNRSTCGVKPYIRATCNPDPDHWVRHFIDWWIDKETGLPIPERDGVIRYFFRDGDSIIWKRRRESFPSNIRQYVKSATFIAAKLTDNPALMKKDPNYMGNLMSLPTHERERLLGGNWNIRLAPGMYFKREMFEEIDPGSVVPGASVRFWDRAATEPHESNPNPDWTVGLKLTKGRNGMFYVEDIIRGRWRPSRVRDVIRNTASQEPETKQIFEEEPGSSGKSEISYLFKELSGFFIDAIRPNRSKEVRAGPVASAAGSGLIKVVRARWNKEFYAELESFPNKEIHDDQVDGLSGAFNYLNLANTAPRVRKL